MKIIYRKHIGLHCHTVNTERKKLVKEAIDIAEGNIALHVEPDNPASICTKLGFSNKYLEMRFNKSEVMAYVTFDTEKLN